MIVAAFRKFLFIRMSKARFDSEAIFAHHFERMLDNPLALRSIFNTMEVLITALVGGVAFRPFAIGLLHASIAHRRGQPKASTSSRRFRFAITGLVKAFEYRGMDRLPGGHSTAPSGYPGARLHRAPRDSCTTPSRPVQIVDCQIHRETGGKPPGLRQGLLGHHPRGIVLPLAPPRRHRG